MEGWTKFFFLTITISLGITGVTFGILVGMFYGVFNTLNISAIQILLAFFLCWLSLLATTGRILYAFMKADLIVTKGKGWFKDVGRGKGK